MFKILILQTQNNLSDERAEFWLRDRLTWMRFLGLGLGDAVPDAIWTFRETLTKAGAIERLFELLDRWISAAVTVLSSRTIWPRSSLISRALASSVRLICSQVSAGIALIVRCSTDFCGLHAYGSLPNARNDAESSRWNASS
jgi:IS5 family transposase